MTERFLDIVNNNDEVIGKEDRKKVHNGGLLHRETHILFVTPDKKIIFQHRAKDKDTYPDLLDATVGGHVDSGMSYEDTAVKEMREETGLQIFFDELVFLKKIKNKSEDAITGAINNTFKMEYGFIFKGNISDLKVEQGKALGFEAWGIDKLFDLSDEDKKKFTPIMIEPEFFGLYKQLGNLI